MLPRKAQNKDAAWKYIDMVNQESWQRRWMEMTDQLPGQSLEPSAEQLQRNPWMADMIRVGRTYLTGFGYAPPSPAIAQRANQFQKLIVDRVLPILSSDAAIAPALKEVQQAILRWEQESGVTGS